jgi:hypothetical protein
MNASGTKRRGIVHTHPQIVEGLVSRSQKTGTIAPGFTPAPWLDMTYQGGRTIARLAFKNFYLGGKAYPAADIARIDEALANAMTDPGLNNVVKQYYKKKEKVTSTFLGSQVLSGPVPKTFDRDAVNPLLQSLLDGGQLKGVDFDNTVVCIYLPPGIILSDTAAGGVGREKPRKAKVEMPGGEDAKDSSLEGLGGYHGSAHVGGKRIYFAVGVYSDVVKKKANGIPFWPDAWKNVVATLYHELNETRTNPDVEEYNRNPRNNVIAWYADVRGGGEIGDIPMNEAGARLGLVMVEVRLASGKSAPIQLMWSNAVHGPQGPFTG